MAKGDESMSSKDNNDSYDIDINLIKAYLDGCESQNRMNISVISSLCNEISAIDVNEENSEEYLRQCADNIIKQCTQIMKMTEIYAILSDGLSPKALIKENIDLSEYLSEFSTECNKKIGHFFKVEYTKSTRLYVCIVRKLMDFCLSMFIRKTAINGGESVKVTYSATKDSVIISAEIIKCSDAVIEGIPESFSTDYAYEIIQMAAKKMNVNFFIEDNGIKLSIPISKEFKATMESTNDIYAKHSFSTLNNILSDLSDISII